MSKVVQAVNAMLSNPEKIDKVIENDEEYYFLYNKKYKWSIKDNVDKIFLYFYPTNVSFDYLATTHPTEWASSIKFVIYIDTDIGTREAKASFRDLLATIKEKLYGVDKLLDEIIDDDIPF
jgi:hypothetical protein